MNFKIEVQLCEWMKIEWPKIIIKSIYLLVINLKKSIKSMTHYVLKFYFKPQN